MNKSVKYQHILAFMLFVFSAVIAVSAITEEDVYRILTEKNVKYDAELVHNGMIAGMLRTIDSRALLLNTNDINRLNNLVAIDSFEKLGNGIDYLKLHGLYRHGSDEICKELIGSTNQHTFGEILDLRDAGGNDLLAVNNVINRFVASNTPLYEVTDNSGSIIEYYHSPSNNVIQSHEPLMVLIDQNTHDASEILATLLKDRDGVMLIGATTKGHSGLMEIVPFSESVSLYIVTKYVLPTGIVGSFTNGVSPDIVVTEGENKESELALSSKVLIGKDISKKAQTDRILMERVANDAVLQRATDILLGLKAVKSVNN